jgi:hypothetical protein
MILPQFYQMLLEIKKITSELLHHKRLIKFMGMTFQLKIGHFERKDLKQFN